MNADIARKTQQDAVYAAEGVASAALPPQAMSLAEAQDFVDNLLNNADWWDAEAPEVYRVEVGPARSRTKSIGWYERDKNAGRIELAPPGRNPLTICHELAHVFCEAKGFAKVHNPGWARCYLTLVYRVMGSEAYKALWYAFQAEGVEVG